MYIATMIRHLKQGPTFPWSSLGPKSYRGRSRIRIFFTFSPITDKLNTIILAAVMNTKEKKSNGDISKNAPGSFLHISIYVFWADY